MKTTNCLESINAPIAHWTAKVTAWRTSDQKNRWLAATLLDIETRPRRSRGYRALPFPRVALKAEIQGKEVEAEHQAA